MKYESHTVSVEALSHQKLVSRAWRSVQFSGQLFTSGSVIRTAARQAWIVTNTFVLWLFASFKQTVPVLGASFA